MAVKNNKEKITLENLAQEMRQGFTETKNAIEELAVATKHGFDGVGEQFKKVDEKFDKMDDRFDKMDDRFDKMDDRFDKMDEKLEDLDKSNNQAHENISLRLNEVAYSFELTALKKRVDVLEKKAKVHV